MEKATHIHPIRSDSDLKKAHARIDEIIKIYDNGAETPELENELDIISTLVEAYETENYPISDLHPIDAIKVVMEEHGLNRAGLGKIIGSRSRASEILNLQRKLSADMMRALHDKLYLPYDVLMQDYKLAPEAEAAKAVKRYEAISKSMSKMTAEMDKRYRTSTRKKDGPITKKSSEKKKA